MLWSIPAASLVQIAAMDENGGAANSNVRRADSYEERRKDNIKTMRTGETAISTLCFHR